MQQPAGKVWASGNETCLQKAEQMKQDSERLTQAFTHPTGQHVGATSNFSPPRSPCTFPVPHLGLYSSQSSPKPTTPERQLQHCLSN